MLTPLLALLLAGCGDSPSTGEPSPPDPGALVMLEQTGGIAGVSNRLTVATDGSFHVTRSNPPLDTTGHLSAEEKESLRVQLEAVDLGRQPTRVESGNSADHFEYAITYDGRTLRLQDDAIPPHVTPLLDQLLNVMDRAGR